MERWCIGPMTVNDRDYQDVDWDVVDFEFVDGIDPEAIQKIIDKYDFREVAIIESYGDPPKEIWYLDLWCPVDAEYCFGVAKFLTEICGTKAEWDYDGYYLSEEQIALEKTAEPVRFPLKEQTAKN